MAQRKSERALRMHDKRVLSSAFLIHQKRHLVTHTAVSDAKPDG